jgi:hypothetical protein
MLAKRQIIAQQFDVVVGETNLNAGLIASSLLRSAPGEHADRGRSEAFKDRLDGFAEAVAVGE